MTTLVKLLLMGISVDVKFGKFISCV